MSKRRQLRSNRFLPEYVTRFKDRHGKERLPIGDGGIGVVDGHRYALPQRRDKVLNQRGSVHDVPGGSRDILVVWDRLWVLAEDSVRPEARSMTLWKPRLLYPHAPPRHILSR
jgi:hypothetical protein